MYTRLAIVIGLVCCVSLAYTSFPPSTVSADVPPPSPAKGEGIYCESKREVYIEIGIGTPKVYATKPDQTYTKNNDAWKKSPAVAVKPAGVCKVYVCPDKLFHTRSSSPISSGAIAIKRKDSTDKTKELMKLPDPAVRADECSSSNKGEPEIETGCYKKCVKHGDKIDIEEMKNMSKGVIQDNYQKASSEASSALKNIDSSKSLGDQKQAIQTALDKAEKLQFWGNRLDDVTDDSKIRESSNQNEELYNKLKNLADASKQNNAGTQYVAPNLLSGQVDRLERLADSSSWSKVVPQRDGGNDPTPRSDTPPPKQTNTFPEVKSGGGDTNKSDNSNTSSSGGMNDFLSGFLRGLTGQTQSAAQTAAEQQQQTNTTYCQSQLGSYAQYISSTNQCVCPTNAPLTNGKCTQLSVSASLSCAPSTIDNGRNALISWSCGGANAAQGSGFETNSQTSGKSQPRVNESAGVKTKTYSLSCINGEVKTNKSCTINVNRPSLVMTMSGSPQTSQQLTMGFSSFGTHACTTLSPDIASINNQTSSVAQGGVSGVGGVRKIAVEDLKQQTRIVVSCETLGNNTLAGGFVITKEPFSVRKVDPQLIGQDTQVAQANYYSTGSGSVQSSQSYQTASASGDTWGTSNELECDPSDPVGTFTTCVLKI